MNGRLIWFNRRIKNRQNRSKYVPWPGFHRGDRDEKTLWVQLLGYDSTNSIRVLKNRLLQTPVSIDYIIQTALPNLNEFWEKRYKNSLVKAKEVQKTPRATEPAAQVEASSSPV